MRATCNARCDGDSTETRSTATDATILPSASTTPNRSINFIQTSKSPDYYRGCPCGVKTILAESSIAVNRCKPLQQTLVMPARLPMTMCYAIVKLIQREMQDDGLVLHLCPPAREAVGAQGVMLNALRLMRALVCMLRDASA